MTIEEEIERGRRSPNQGAGHTARVTAVVAVKLTNAYVMENHLQEHSAWSTQVLGLWNVSVQAGQEGPKPALVKHEWHRLRSHADKFRFRKETL